MAEMFFQADGRILFPHFPLQRTHYIISVLRKLILLKMRGINSHKQL